MATSNFNFRYRDLASKYPDSFRDNNIWTQATLPEEEEKVTIKLVNNFLVGCDPEFCVLKDGKPINLDAYMLKEGEVGSDHAGWEAEIRPKPAKGTYALLKRIRTIILTNACLNPKLAEGYKWRAGAAVELGNNRLLTLGGHVHFGLLPRGEDPTDKDGAKYDERIKALDRTTKYLEALDILPRDESTLRRDKGDRQNAQQQYGKWGDVRVAGDDVRGGRHIEYRTMASWLFDPKVAYVALTAAKLAAAAPQITLDTLKGNNFSYENFCNFFEVFRHKDTNAKRALEKLIDNKKVTALQAKPDVHFRGAWETLAL